MALVVTAFCAQVPLRVGLALARRAPHEAAEVLRAAAMLVRALPALLKGATGTRPASG